VGRRARGVSLGKARPPTFSALSTPAGGDGCQTPFGWAAGSDDPLSGRSWHAFPHSRALSQGHPQLLVRPLSVLYQSLLCHAQIMIWSSFLVRIALMSVAPLGVKWLPRNGPSAAPSGASLLLPHGDALLRGTTRSRERQCLASASSETGNASSTAYPPSTFSPRSDLLSRETEGRSSPADFATLVLLKLHLHLSS